MIVSRVLGGLGNQMFQYAVGRALSIEHNTQLCLDVSDFSGYDLHQGFELDRIFKAPIFFADTTGLRDMLGWKAHAYVRHLLVRPALRWLCGRHLVVEPHFQYWHGIQSSPPPCYLIGYWQSERYFAQVAQTIRDDFMFRLPMSAKNQVVAQDILGVKAVSLHVRRGNYASNPKTLANHGLCSMAYYKKAINYLLARLQSPVFFIFSDDPGWVQTNLKINAPIRYIDHNTGAESYNDMRLMSLCKYHIIANSTFSWWGAWLNSSKDKIVIAPKNWFANGNNTQDLLPNSWVSM